MTSTWRILLAGALMTGLVAWMTAVQPLARVRATSAGSALSSGRRWRW